MILSCHVDFIEKVVGNHKGPVQSLGRSVQQQADVRILGCSGLTKYFRIFNRIFWYLQRDTESKIDIQSDYWVVYKVVYTIYYGLTSGTDFHQTVIFAVAPGRGHQDYFVHPEQPASPLDSQCLSPGTPLQRLQDLRS